MFRTLRFSIVLVLIIIANAKDEEDVAQCIEEKLSPAGRECILSDSGNQVNSLRNGYQCLAEKINLIKDGAYVNSTDSNEVALITFFEAIFACPNGEGMEQFQECSVKAYQDLKKTYKCESKNN